MDTQLLRLLLNRSESETLDFKSGQYPFAGAADPDREELLKDIIALANAWKSSPAYIIIGVNEVGGRAVTVSGVTTHLPDHSVQQFINGKTNSPVRFRIISVPWEKVELDIIEVDEKQDRPIWLLKQFGRLLAQTVYLRRGSSTDIADPDEVARMGEMEARAEIRTLPVFEVEFADPIERIRWGTTATVTCTLLTDPSPVEPPPVSRASPIGTVLSQLSRPVFPTMGKLTIIPSGESREDLIDFAKKNARYVPIGFWLQNVGPVNASGISAEVRIIPPAGVEILSGYDRPERPGSNYEAIIMQTPNTELEVREDNGARLITFQRDRLQPKAEHWVSGCFGVSAGQNGECRANVRIFADDLPNPQELTLILHVSVVARPLTEADLESD